MVCSLHMHSFKDSSNHKYCIVPLSAYNIIQEFTYHPNDTLPAILLGSLVPSALQKSADSFTPQVLNVGYTIMLDNYIFNHTIAQAFDGVDTNKPLSSFLYYNNPFSESCDVVSLSGSFVAHPDFRTIHTGKYHSSAANDQGSRVCVEPRGPN